MADTKYCSDCGAELQRLPSGLRCPWAREGLQGTVWSGGELVLVCRSPYERTRETQVIVRDTRTVQR